MRRALPLYATIVLAAPAAWAVDTTLTQAGFTGLGITPSAHLLNWGTMEATYDNQMPGIRTNPAGHNYVLGFGLLPNMEVVGRIATAELSTNCFTGPCRGPRDLSVSLKAGIGLDTAGRFRVAAGVTDFGGAATNFRSYYGVASFNEGPYELSAGIARRAAVSSPLRQSPLHGPFLAAAWQPLPWVRGHLEYTDSNAWAGVRLFAPPTWLPEGWKAYVGLNQRLTSTNLTERNWLTAGVSIPLYKVPQMRGSADRVPPAALAAQQLPLPAYEARLRSPLRVRHRPQRQVQPRCSRLRARPLRLQLQPRRPPTRTCSASPRPSAAAASKTSGWAACPMVPSWHAPTMPPTTGTASMPWALRSARSAARWAPARPPTASS